jgi:hypothetical protein
LAYKNAGIWKQNIAHVEWNCQWWTCVCVLRILITKQKILPFSNYNVNIQFLIKTCDTPPTLWWHTGFGTLLCITVGVMVFLCPIYSLCYNWRDNSDCCTHQWHCFPLSSVTLIPFQIRVLLFFSHTCNWSSRGSKQTKQRSHTPGWNILLPNQRI